ncbi:hypothetical protein EON64_03130 [archaeon]|nr:MAG: hypothetical protein EON64_03130 [archaeon]
MESTNHIAQQLQKVFGHVDLYQILEVEKTASASEIKKAYMKQALQHHPDKGGNAETFQGISAAFTILSDAERRAEYDENGLVDVEDMLNSYETSESYQFWFNYFRNLNPKVTIESIEDFAKTYVGSEEEENDLINAFETYEGDLGKIMEVIMFAEEGSEQRIVDTLEQFIKQGKIKKNNTFSQSSQKILAASRKSSKKRKSKSKGVDGEGMSDLALMIAQKQQSRAAGLASIFAKYGGEEEGEELSEEEFQQAQRKAMKKGRGEQDMGKGGRPNKKSKN